MLLIFLLFSCFSLAAQSPKKIVGLVQVRNEEVLIEQCVHALSFYTDAIVVLDDASNDNTVNICRSLSQRYNIEKIVCNATSAWLHRLESDNRQKLLDAGRAIGGTHFIVIDADEMLSANCMHNNYLKSLIYQLNPGDRLNMPIIHLWKSVDYYRTYFNEAVKFFIFCDDGVCSYIDRHLHVVRVPLTLRGGACLELHDKNYVLMHFGYVNWHAALVRQVWYKCLERIRDPLKAAKEINDWYPAHKEEYEQVYPLPRNWLDGYTFFNPQLFELCEKWRSAQLLSWFKEYGRSYFAELEIEHVFNTDSKYQ